MGTTNKRNSNIELLRVFSMLMIIAHHYVVYGVMQNYDPDIAYISYQQGSVINKIIAQLLLPGGVVGVGIFFLIMGYFGIQSNHIKVTPIIKDTLFYSVLGLFVYLILWILGFVDLYNIKNSILSCITPVANSTYWFVSVYIILSMMKPFLNQVVESIGGGYKICTLLIVLLIYYSIVRYNTATYLGIINGFVFFIIGAVIKKYETMLCSKKSILYLILGLTGWILYVLFNNISWFDIDFVNGILSIVGICFWGTMSAACFFLFFISKAEFLNTKINKIASTTFSIYLIHEHPLFRRTLWSSILHVEQFQWGSPYFILYAIASIILIFTCSAAIDIFFKQVLMKVKRKRYLS